ncbi:hypothetical protein [Neofamilia massiliensis]|uniref:hypothetical protein n=1 Tax=Neofamilia massiliensis TaxID=1673724 RepID=UPI0006BB808D|nr:hypothetical protein [Neofamilia massiliensis]
MTEFTTTEAQRKAKEKWQQENREKSKRYSYKSTAKNFINNYATEEDLKELLDLIEERRSNL